MIISITAQEYLTERNEMQVKLFPSARPLPGVVRLIQHLKKHQVPLAVATSSHQAHFDLKTSQNKELFDLFDVIVTGDQVIRGKPEPDIFLEAAKRLKITDPKECLVFEDAPSGVKAAIAAGMPVIWVPDPNCDKSELIADQVLESLEHFQPERWGFPSF